MTPTDEVAISNLQRRRIEGRVLVPFIQTLRQKIGEDATRDIVDATIRQLAAEDGAGWAGTFGQSIASLRQLAEDLWAGGGSLDIEMLGQSEDHLDFNVTRCRYAEFYKDLGLADIGYRVQCNRDHAMIAGFNPDLELSRSRTLMEGGACCDFRYRKKA
jgi:hypothetical protein